MEAFRRILEVLLFVFIWIIIPMMMAVYYNNPALHLIMMLTWLPAWIIVAYIGDDN